MDRRNPVNLDELFVPLSTKSKECDNLLAVTEADESEEDSASESRSDATAPIAAASSITTVAAVIPSPADTTAKASNLLVNDINTRFSNDCTQTVGPYLDMADPSRKVSVRDLFKPLDSKSKEMQNLTEEPLTDDDDGGGGSDSGHHQTSANGAEHQDEHPSQQTQTCGPVMIDSSGGNSSTKPNLERIFDQNPDQVPIIHDYVTYTCRRLVENTVWD